MAICKLCGKELKGVNSEYQHYPGVHNMKFSRKTGELTPIGVQGKVSVRAKPQNEQPKKVSEDPTKQALALLVANGIMTQEQASLTLKTLMPKSTPTFDFSKIIRPILSQPEPEPEPDTQPSPSSKVKPHPIRNVDAQFAFNQEAATAALVKRSNTITEQLVKRSDRIGLSINESVYEQIDGRDHIIDILVSIFEGQIAINEGQLQYYNGQTIVSEPLTVALATLIADRTIDYLDLLVSIDLNIETTNNIVGNGNYANQVRLHQRLSNLSGLKDYVRKNGINPEALEIKPFQITLIHP